MALEEVLLLFTLSSLFLSSALVSKTAEFQGVFTVIIQYLYRENMVLQYAGSSVTTLSFAASFEMLHI